MPDTPDPDAPTRRFGESAPHTPACDAAPPPAAPPLPHPLSHLPEYDVIRELGRGGMGAVYLARNRILDRLEALKVVTRPDIGARFLREVQVAAGLSHPHVVAAYAARVVGGVLVFAMEYVDGVDLHRLVRQRGPLPVPTACGYARQAALGLQHAAERGMVHRDVKPQNLILARTGGGEVVKVLDFGLAKATAERPADPALTREWESVGTPGYMAPEQATAAPDADARADVYGLGCTLYFLLTGGPPFDADTPHEVLRLQREAEPPAVDRARPDVPAALARVIGRMMARDPADRYQTPAEVAAALKPFADAAPDSRGRGANPGRRARAVRAAGAVLAVTCLAALSVAGAGGFRDPEPPVRPTARPVSYEPVGDFVPLFNGRDLSGWVLDGGGPGDWRVEDGAIVAAGPRNPAGPSPTGSWLLTDRDYRHFRLRFECQLARGGNSGVGVRAVPGERPILAPGGDPTPTPYHLQVELADPTPGRPGVPTGQVNGAAKSDGPALRPTRPAPLRPAGEWNAVEVELLGQMVRVTVNGEVVQAGSLDRLAALGSLYPGLKREAGRIGFQQHTRVARFRDIMVQEFAPARR